MNAGRVSPDNRVATIYSVSRVYGAGVGLLFCAALLLVFVFSDARGTLLSIAVLCSAVALPFLTTVLVVSGGDAAAASTQYMNVLFWVGSIAAWISALTVFVCCTYWLIASLFVLASIVAVSAAIADRQAQRKLAATSDSGSVP